MPASPAVRSAFILLEIFGQGRKGGLIRLGPSGFASNQAEMVGALAENPSWWIERIQHLHDRQDEGQDHEGQQRQHQKERPRLARTCAGSSAAFSGRPSAVVRRGDWLASVMAGLITLAKGAGQLWQREQG